jgi:hypothetical protein
MSLHSAVALVLAELLLHPKFRVTSYSTYLNLSCRRGLRFVCIVQDVLVFISQSVAVDSPDIREVAEVLVAPDWLDQSKSIIYFARKRNGIGLRLEAWRDGTWYQVFIPITAEARKNQTILGILETARRRAA